MTWRTMDSAPKDGSSFLVYGLVEGKDTIKHQHLDYIGSTFVCSWWEGDRLNPPQWRVSGPVVPCFWQPYPEAPDMEQAKEQRVIVLETMKAERKAFYDKLYGIDTTL